LANSIRSRKSRSHSPGRKLSQVQETHRRRCAEGAAEIIVEVRLVRKSSSKRSVGATLAAMALGLARAGWHHGNGIAHLRRQFHRKTPYQPPPMGVITLPVPRQSGHTSPSSLPVPAQRRQMFSPDMGVPAGTSSGLDELGWVLDPVVRLDF
jgi:hypothetical protein